MKQIISSVSDLQIDHGGVCKGCTLGRNVKKPFPSSEHRSKEILDLVHSDVCGPISIKYLGSALYYVSFINDFYDFSRQTWIYLMKSKDEVFRKLKEFKFEVENLTKKKIKIVR